MYPGQNKYKRFKMNLKIEIKISAILKKDLELIMNFEEKFKLKIKSISYVDRAERNEIGVELFLDSIKHLEKLFLELNYKIISCDRVLFSCLTKKDLTRGQWRDLTKQEIINLQSF